MRQISVQSLGLAALLLVGAVSPLFAEIEDGGAVKVDACASDGQHLGLSRIVEIDTAGGGDIGGEKPSATHFLNDGEVVLTFDDGPSRADTKAILKALADQCTKATFFMVGQMALADPETVRDVANAGHTIGTHTWSHANLRAIGLEGAKRQIESAISTVSKAKGTPVAPLFRFPYLSSSKQVEGYLKSRNIEAVWVDIDSKDYRTHDPNVVLQRILADLAKEKKGIILMHDIHPWTAKMLPDLLSQLHERGFKVVQMVPKQQVETIAAYDAIADKVLAAKTAARTANPMASRALVWSMAATPGPRTGKQRALLHARKASAKTSPDEGLSDTESSPAAATPAGTVKSKKAGKPKDGDGAWQLFSF